MSFAAEYIVTSTNRVGRKVPNMVVGDMDESEILAMAPSMVCDRVHWSTLEDFSASVIVPDLPMTSYTRQWSDGQHRIWVAAGTGIAARELIKIWCTEHEVEALNMRVEPRVPYRDVDSIPGDIFQRLLLATVDWLHPRCYSIRRRIVADFELLSDEDLRPMMYLFVSDHADRFDEGRIGKNGTLNLASFMLGKIRKWPQDAARAAYGRNLVDDHMHMNQAVDDSMATVYRKPTKAELASRMQTSVADLRRRELAVAEFSGMRYHDVIVTGGAYDDGDGVDAAGDVDVELDATAFQSDAILTRSILDAVRNPVTGRGSQGPDTLGLAAVFLSFWGEMSRQEVASALQVLPKTAAAATQRVINQISPARDI